MSSRKTKAATSATKTTKRRKKQEDLVPPATTESAQVDDFVGPTEVTEVAAPVAATTTTSVVSEVVNVGAASCVEERSMVQDVNSALATLSLSREVVLPDNVISAQSEQLNSQHFYLYYNLEEQASKSSLDPTKNQRTLIANIKKLDTEGLNIVFVIIRMFCVKNKNSKMFEMPYKAKILKEHTTGCYDIEFDLKELPERLQLMLHLFCKRHLDNIEEESRIRFLF